MKLIKSTTEIKDINIEYSTNGIKIFKIEFDIPDGYCIYGHVCGDNKTFICKGANTVYYWKTLKRAIQAIKRFTYNYKWGFGINFKFEDLDS